MWGKKYTICLIDVVKCISIKYQNTQGKNKYLNIALEKVKIYK